MGGGKRADGARNLRHGAGEAQGGLFALPFLFIDEAESILGTRRASRFSNILSTLVPMFCTEMDGIESLSEVVIILASNRADLIDPAILRPGRIDRKIKVNRPDRDGAREIFRIYLGAESALRPDPRPGGRRSVPAAIEKLVDAMVELAFSHRDENPVPEHYAAFRKEGHPLPGRSYFRSWIIASIIERAKGSRHQTRHRQQGGGRHQRETDLRGSFEAEYLENDIFPPTDITEDWLQLLDYDAENVVKVSPVRSRAGKGTPRSAVI